MTLQNKTKADIIISSTISFSFIALIGFIFIFAKSEGTLEDGFIVNFIADYVIYLFPLVLLYEYFQLHNFYILLVTVGLNILLYSFVLKNIFLEKLISSQKYKPFKLTTIVVYAILLIPLGYLIFLIATSKD